MRRKRLLHFVVIGVAFVAGGTAFRWQERQVRDGQRLFAQVASLVSDRFIDSIGAGKMFELAAEGVVAGLNDPYSELIPPRDVDTFDRGVTGRYGGIGAQVETRSGNRVYIERIYPNTPAEQGGVLEGDLIVGVDGTSVRGFEMGKVTERLRGEPGTKVRVTLEREGASAPVELTLTRAVVRIPAVPYAIALDGNIGYIPLQTFNENAADEVSASVTKLVNAGVTGIVLDMRGNTGGILEQALRVSSLFLDAGQSIVSVRGRAGMSETSSAPDAEPTLKRKIPLVVLTDESSASATEIVAGALQDHDRALVLGARSYGKGLVQRVFGLDGGYALKLTTGKWYTPSGRSIHRDRAPDGRPVAGADSGSIAGLPMFKSDGGRTLRGGGGILPDIIIEQDTIATAERDYYRAVAPKAGVLLSILHDRAVQWRVGIRPDFQVAPAWVQTVVRQLDSAGVRNDPALNAARDSVIGRELERRITRSAFGDSGLARRQMPEDRQLMGALKLIKGAQSQAAVFTAAKSVRPPAPRP